MVPLSNLRSWLLSVSLLHRLCRVATQNNWNFWSMGFDLHDSISEQYFFLTSAIEIRVCKNPGAMHESRLSDVHITSVKRFPLHDNGVPPFTRERSGSVVECLTRDRRAAGSSLTGVTALWSLSKTHLS